MYTPSMTKQNWINAISMDANQVYNALSQGKILQEKFYNITYGKTDAEIMTMLGLTADDLLNIRYALGVLLDMKNELDLNNRFTYLEPFLLG